MRHQRDIQNETFGGWCRNITKCIVTFSNRCHEDYLLIRHFTTQPFYKYDVHIFELILLISHTKKYLELN